MVEEVDYLVRCVHAIELKKQGKVCVKEELRVTFNLLYLLLNNILSNNNVPLGLTGGEDKWSADFFIAAQ